MGGGPGGSGRLLLLLLSAAWGQGRVSEGGWLGAPIGEGPFVIKSGLRYSTALPLGDSQTGIVLLQDPGSGRVRRDADTAGQAVQEVAEATEDTNHVYGGSEPEQGQGPEDPLLEELEKNLNNVDISNNKLMQNIKNFHDDGNYGNDNDTHKYYKEDFKETSQFGQFYKDLDMANKTDETKGMVKEHSMLSQSYRRAATINLKFKFPFYGHEVENITIATGGFLYTGDYVHSWLAATQYIAPLMANFDTSNNQHAKIRYLDDGEKLIVEWKDVYLQEREAEGPFTFQVTLHKKGDIWFAYRKIPLEIYSIKDDDHPVKVGLSDAYIIDRTIYFARRKTIYEYHRLSMKDKQIRNETAIVFHALETCNMNKDCQSCLTHDSATEAAVGCRWCPDLGRCSDGTDRNRQDWLKRKCDIHNVSTADQCDQQGAYDYHDHREGDHHGFLPDHHKPAKMSDYGIQAIPANASSANPGAIVSAVFSCLLIVTLLGWLGYAYFNPNTSSGRFLIKYRPGAWRWRQSGGRYTAASIHM